MGRGRGYRVDLYGQGTGTCNVPGRPIWAGDGDTDFITRDKGRAEGIVKSVFPHLFGVEEPPISAPVVALVGVWEVSGVGREPREVFQGGGPT